MTPFPLFFQYGNFYGRASKDDLGIFHLSSFAIIIARLERAATTRPHSALSKTHRHEQLLPQALGGGDRVRVRRTGAHLRPPPSDRSVPTVPTGTNRNHTATRYGRDPDKHTEQKRQADREGEPKIGYADREGTAVSRGIGRTWDPGLPAILGWWGW